MMAGFSHFRRAPSREKQTSESKEKGNSVCFTRLLSDPVDVIYAKFGITGVFL
jgi:hypothetical protein